MHATDEMAVPRFIEEVRRRPTLWDVTYAEYKNRVNTSLQWQEIAEIMGTDVELCKRKWKNLRDAYRAEVRRTERRIERLKAAGVYDDKQRPTQISKWVFFEPMSFINETRRPRSKRHTEATTPEEPDNCGGDSGNERNSPPEYDTMLDGFENPIKIEPHTTDDEDDEEDDDMLFEEFKTVATPQAARRLSNSISMAEDEAAATSSAGNAAGRQGKDYAGPSCKCTKRSDDQVHFLENLEREEQKLMQSTRQDMFRADHLSHVGDSDYNFLVSFLPQMKKMSELQNLHFRAKMSELLLNTMMTPGPSPIGTPLMSLAAPFQRASQIDFFPQQTPQQPQTPQQQGQPQDQQDQLRSLQSELMESDTGTSASTSANWS